jgi:hypothetical protein
MAFDKSSDPIAQLMKKAGQELTEDILAAERALAAVLKVKPTPLELVTQNKAQPLLDIIREGLKGDELSARVRSEVADNKELALAAMRMGFEVSPLERAYAAMQAKEFLAGIAKEVGGPEGAATLEALRIPPVE